MRQKTRKILIFIALLLFPITLNYFSPYVCIDGAMLGIVSGSLILFSLMFLTAIFFGRAWCGWLCPMAGLSDYAMNVNNKNVNVKKLKIIRYSIFVIWFAILVVTFVIAGVVKGLDPFHMTERIISVDEPLKYITYYMVLTIFAVLTFSIGKRGACHSICWMSPFLVGGYRLGKTVKVKQLRIKCDANKCINCKVCNKKCPMSINVNETVKEGIIDSSDCILCGECVDNCNQKVLRYGIR